MPLRLPALAGVGAGCARFPIAGRLSTAEIANRGGSRGATPDWQRPRSRLGAAAHNWSFEVLWCEGVLYTQRPAQQSVAVRRLGSLRCLARNVGAVTPTDAYVAAKSTHSVTQPSRTTSDVQSFAPIDDKTQMGDGDGRRPTPAGTSDQSFDRPAKPLFT